MAPTFASELVPYGVDPAVYAKEIRYIGGRMGGDGSFHEFKPRASLTDRLYRTLHDLYPFWRFDSPKQNNCYACGMHHGANRVYDNTPRNAECENVRGKKQP